jgi:hypothetical protein
MINAKFQPVVETLAMGWEQFRRQRHRARSLTGQF